MAVGKHPIGCGRAFAYSAGMKSSTNDKVEGTAKRIAGTVKEAAGRATGNDRLKAAGKAEKAGGLTQEKIGEIERLLKL